MDVVNSNYERAKGLIGDCVESVVNSLPVSLNQTVKMQLVPNPNRGQFEMIVDGGLLRNAQVEVLNLLGETVYTELVNSGNNRHTLQLNQAAAGVYTVQLTNGSYKTSSRLVLMK